MNPKPVLGVIGGSGLYDFPDLKNVEEVLPETPFGVPSAPVVIGNLGEKRVAFLARHGIGHRFNPSEVNYRANIYALKMLGINRVVSISACGSLREDFAPGHIVIPDQLFDFTRNRNRTFFEGGIVVHISTADPFCPDLSNNLFQAVSRSDAVVHKCGQMVTIEGPRFSTRAESNVFRAWGMSLIGMTTSPEAFLAREAEMCYAVMAHVTDFDVWHMSEEAVSVNMVIATLNRNTEIARKSIIALVETLPETPACTCDDTLREAIITRPELIDPSATKRLALLLNKYLK